MIIPLEKYNRREVFEEAWKQYKRLKRNGWNGTWGEILKDKWRDHKCSVDFINKNIRRQNEMERLNPTPEDRERIESCGRYYTGCYCGD